MMSKWYLVLVTNNLLYNIYIILMNGITTVLSELEHNLAIALKLKYFFMIAPHLWHLQLLDVQTKWLAIVNLWKIN